jgi:hypothetical protein
MRFVLIYLMLLLALGSHAQRVRVYGNAACKEAPLGDVLIIVFQSDTFYKRLISNHKGHFGFNIGADAYTILFYKPGYAPDAYGVVNKLENELQKIPLSVNLVATRIPMDSLLLSSSLMTALKPSVAKKYLQYIYDYEKSRRKLKGEVSAKITRKRLIEYALAERERFKNYSQDSTINSTLSSKGKVVNITVGLDHYQIIVDEVGEKKYTKNDKAITEITFNFETTRRFDALLDKVHKHYRRR